MGKIDELKGVEEPVVEWLSKLGWEPKTHKEMKEYNRSLFKEWIKKQREKKQ